MLYSVRMRAAQGGAHEQGGTHISGAERLVGEAEWKQVAAEMLERAVSHSKGSADFINLIVETVSRNNVQEITCLPIQSVAGSDVPAGRKAAQAELIKAGVAPAAASAGVAAVAGLQGSMRGAMVLCAKTGKRLDDSGERGIRVSRMDIADNQAYLNWLRRQGYGNMHIREALVLASKVLSAPGVVAELCWSDDPEYTTGYIASATVYTRFTNLKPYGCSIGGRVFFVKENTDLAQLTDYLQYRPVMVKVPAEETNDAVSR
ncbi:6-carboxyhexanoate--CoA ligase [Sporomusa rhizae]|uniref:6-carboxyhexanoate--CoA ligase n=1 Tax=Sporomusa rhizae TaxID=357999 RepID=UPI00352B51C0